MRSRAYLRSFSTVRRPVLPRITVSSVASLHVAFAHRHYPQPRVSVAAMSSMGSSSGGAHHDTMLSFRFSPGASRPTREEIPIPHPKSDEVLIKILAGGVCHSDVGILDTKSNLHTISPNHYTLGTSSKSIFSSWSTNVTRFEQVMKVQERSQLSVLLSQLPIPT